MRANSVDSNFESSTLALRQSNLQAPKINSVNCRRPERKEIATPPTHSHWQWTALSSGAPARRIADLLLAEERQEIPPQSLFEWAPHIVQRRTRGRAAPRISDDLAIAQLARDPAIGSLATPMRPLLELNECQVSGSCLRLFIAEPLLRSQVNNSDIIRRRRGIRETMPPFFGGGGGGSPKSAFLAGFVRPIKCAAAAAKSTCQSNANTIGMHLIPAGHCGCADGSHTGLPS